MSSISRWWLLTPTSISASGAVEVEQPERREARGWMMISGGSPASREREMRSCYDVEGFRSSRGRCRAIVGAAEELALQQLLHGAAALRAMTPALGSGLRLGRAATAAGPPMVGDDHGAAAAQCRS